MVDPRYFDVDWVQNKLIEDNNTGKKTIWSARFQVTDPTARDALIEEAKLVGACGARVDGGSEFVVLEFNPLLTPKIAAAAVAHRGILCNRNPRTSLGLGLTLLREVCTEVRKS